jgi:hypothetical protein
MVRAIISILASALLMLAACGGGGSSPDLVSVPGAGGAPPPGCPQGCTDAGSPAFLVVSLEASQVIGGSTERGSGHGELKVDLNTGVLLGQISFTGVAAEQVTLNRGYAGENGPVLIRLDEIRNAEWALPPSATLTVDDAKALNAGGLYVNATSTKSPDGAVRGQVMRPAAAQVSFYTLFGSQVVPAATSSATATSAVTLSADVAPSGVVGSDTNIVLHLNVHGLEDISSVHVHEALAGDNGPVVVELVRDAANPSHWFTGQTLFDEDAVAAFRNGYCTNGGCDPRLYVDVHSGSHPDGELRAQLGYRTAVHFTALSGDDVVPGSASSHSGTVATTITDIVGWDWTLELAMNVNLQGLDDATAVTLNYAPVGQNGPVVYALERDPVRLTHWYGRALLNEPAAASAHGWYFNVTTPNSPDGELRGQWETQYSEWTACSTGWFGDVDVRVRSVSPADGSTVASWPPAIRLEFNCNIHNVRVGLDSIELLASGGDASFREGNESPITPTAVTAEGPTMTIEFGQSAQANDIYQLSVHYEWLTNSLQSADGTFVSTFAIDGSQPTASFAQLQEEIFTPSCAQVGCHGGSRPAFGLDLFPGTAFDSIVGVPSAENPGLDLVEPGDPDASYIVGKLFRPWWDPHPVGQARLSNASMQRLRQWIEEGARDD